MYMQVLYHRIRDTQDARQERHSRSGPGGDIDDADDSVTSVLFDSPTTVLTALITFVSIWSLASLMSYHCYLLSVGETTNENLRDTFSGSETSNPWNRGYLGNVVGVCCVTQDGVNIPDQSGTMSADDYILQNLR